MKTLYLECAMGAAGDMLMGALYELCPEKEQFLEVMNRLIPDVAVSAETVTRQGIAGTHMRVRIHGQEEEGHGHHHAHRTPADIDALIDGFPLPEPVRTNAKKTYQLISQAEARVHGCAPGEVHFHEVGSLDAVMDVSGVCYLLYLLAPDAVTASVVAVGSGTVSAAHGVLPVPAPATALLLQGIPITVGDISGELCTPTGAALLRQFAENFGAMPAGTILGCGYGCGTKEFPRANCLRAFLLETASGETNDTVTELKANIDDMSGEALGFAMERLLEAGALDVSYIPVQMKKNRPGVLLLCLCRPQDADRLAKEILIHTSTFGVRRTDCARYVLAVDRETAETAFGAITCKIGSGYGVTKRKPEYEDAARAAREAGATLETVAQSVNSGKKIRSVAKL